MKQHYIPRYLIDKGHVNLVFNEDNTMTVELDKSISNELKSWPRRKARHMKEDICNTLEYWFKFEPINSQNIEQMYDQVFTGLRQIY